MNNEASIKDWNNKNIVLIPKVKKPTLVGDFRPISLCNVKYKTVTKVLANWLKIILDKTILMAQFAFIPGRVITDNIMVGHECLYILKNRKLGKSGLAAVKLDNNKAYNRVEGCFLKDITRRLGFDPRWNKLIMNCITLAKFSILIDGEAK